MEMGSQQDIARGHKVVPVLPSSIHFRYCDILHKQCYIVVAIIIMSLYISWSSIFNMKL